MQNYSVTSNIITITPELASDILKGNTMNRPLNRITVSDYATQMKKGLWRLNGEPIIISNEGGLLDGQHRLQAVVESGIPIQSVVIYNVDKTSFSTIDTGRVRTAGDLFAIENIDNYAQKSAAVSAYFRLSKQQRESSAGNFTSSNVFNYSGTRELRVSKAEMLDFYKKNKNTVDEVVSTALKCDRKVRLMTVSTTAAYMLYLIINKNHPKEKVFSFFYEMFGVEKETNKTLGVLRTYFLRHLSKQRILTSRQRHIYIVKAWKAYITGKELSVLSYNPDKEKGNITFI